MTNDNTSNVNNATFGRVPTTSLEWLANNTSCPIAKLWAISWFADPFGSRFVRLPCLQVGESSFKKARKLIKDAGLFSYEPKKDEKDSRKTQYWQVKNLLGCRVNNITVETEIESPITTPIEKIEKIEVASEDLEGIYRDLEYPITTSILPQPLTQQESCNASRSFQDTKQDKEKEINNKEQEREATLNATPQNEYEQETESLSVEYVPTKELSAIAKAKYGDQLPDIAEGYRRKLIRLDVNGITTLYILHLLESEVLAVENLMARDDGSHKEIYQFLNEYLTYQVAIFSFVGKEMQEFARCG